MDCGEAGLASESRRVLKRLLVEGVRALPRLGGEEVLSRVGAVLSRVETDVSRVGLVLAWDRAAARDLPRARAAGLPLGVEVEVLDELGEAGAAASAAVGVAGELVVEPEAERFLPARGVGGRAVELLAPVLRTKMRPSLSAVSMK